MKMYINEDTIKEVAKMLSGHLMAHKEEMDTAYSDSDDEDANRLDVSLKIVFEAKTGGVNIKTSIAFTTGKVSEKDERLTFPGQLKLEEVEK